MAVDLAARLLPRSSSSHPRAGARVRFSRTSAEGTPITVRAVVRSGRLGAAESLCGDGTVPVRPAAQPALI